MVACCALGLSVPRDVFAADAAPGYHIVKRIPMSDGWWDYASFDPVHRRLFVSRGDGVMRLDVDTGYQDAHLIPGSEGRASIVLPGGDTLLSTMAGYAMAILYAASDGKVSGMIKMAQVPDAAVYDPMTRLVWVMGRHGKATLIDPVAAKAGGEGDIGDQLEFAVTDGAGRLFVNVVNKGEVAVVDTRSRKVLNHFPMRNCEEPTGLAYVAQFQRLISVCSNGLAKMLDANNGRELASLGVGRDADAVIYDSQRQRAFIPSAEDGSLSVLAVRSANAVEVLERDQVQMGTRTGALDPKTGLLYLPTAKFGPKNKLGFPEPLRGSVELLVLAPVAVSSAP